MPSQKIQPIRILSFDLVRSKLGGSFAITDSDQNRTELYAVNASPKGKPTLTIYPWSEEREAQMNRPWNVLNSFMGKPADDALGTVSLHSWSSKIDVSIHGECFQMKRKDMLSSGHSFKHSAQPLEMQWKEEDFISDNLKLVDENKRVIALYRKNSRMKKLLSSNSRNKSSSELHILVPLEDHLLDIVVLTGLAAAEQRRQSNESWDKVIEETITGF